MTNRQQHENQYFYFYAVLILMAITLFTTTLTTAESSGDQPRTIRFELRLASYEKVEGWESVPGHVPAETIWISPEVTLTNADVAQARPDRGVVDDFVVRLLLTQDGALKLARLTKSHIGEFVAVILDDRVTSVPRIMDEISGGRAMLHANFTEEEAGLIANGITVR